MKKTFLLPIILLTTSCAGTYNPYEDMTYREMVWQGMHVVDAAQTYSASKDSCYLENNPVTKRLIGKKPKSSEVLIWGMASSYVHAAASKWLDKTDMFSGPTKKMIRAMDVGLKFMTIQGNHSIGVRFGTGNNHCNRD